MTWDVIPLGNLVADLVMPIPSLPLEHERHQAAHNYWVEAGGICNFHVMARRLGLSVAPLGGIGGDHYGRQLRALLENEGVDLRHVLTFEQPTQLCLVLVDDAGQHVFVSIRAPRADLTLIDDWPTQLAQGRALYFNTHGLTTPLSAERTLVVLEKCRELSIPTFFDPGPVIPRIPREVMVRSLQLTTTLILTYDEAKMWVGELAPEATARQLLTDGPKLVALKLGGDGCILATTETLLHVPGFAVPVRDTTGAGDAFGAAVVYAHLHNHSLAQMGRLANAVGAVTVTKLAAGTKLPWWHEVEALLNGNA